LSQKLKPGVVVLGPAPDGKASIAVRVTDELTGKLNAGAIVREVSAIVGGKGGGKADMATGGGTQPEKLDQALSEAPAIIGRLHQAGRP
jgi:alanyl-tRNA synthetase